MLTSRRANGDLSVQHTVGKISSYFSILLAGALAACGPAVIDGSGGRARAPAGKGDSDDDRFSATAVLKDHEHLELVPDTPWKEIGKVLMFGGSASIVPLQVQLMRTLPDAEYFVVPSGRNEVSEQTYLDAMSEAGVEPADLIVRYVESFTKPLTDWTQDRLMRFRHDVKDHAVLLPVRSPAIGMNEYAAFELGVPRYLEEQFAGDFVRFEHEQYYSEHVVDNATGELYGYSSAYASWYRASLWRLGYGDGGDRVTTESTMFVGAPAYAKMRQTIESQVRLDGAARSYEELLAKLFKKQRVISVGDADPAVQYLFHLDLFLSAFDGDDGKTTVILGSPLLALDELFGVDGVQEIDQLADLIDQLPSLVDRLPDWCLKDRARWQRRISSYWRIRKDLQARSYLRVVEIPILFFDLSFGQTAIKPTITFNNGLMTQREGKPTFVTVSYRVDRPEIDAVLAKAEDVVKETLDELGLRTVFLPGGENTVRNGGELRCTAGVIEFEAPAAPPPPEEDLFFDDFENARDWAHTGLWHRIVDGSCADPAQASGKVAWHFGDEETCSYQTTPRTRVQGTLTSPEIEGISPTSALTFSFLREVEKTSATSSKAYDVTAVKVAEADSDDWQVVWSRDSRTPSGASWMTAEPIGLGSFAGKAIRIRFAFDSIDAYVNARRGWLIDDVRVSL